MRVAVVTPYFSTPSHPVGGVGSHYALLVRNLAPLVEALELVVPTVEPIAKSEASSLPPNVTLHWVPMSAPKSEDQIDPKSRKQPRKAFRRRFYNLALNLRVARKLRHLQRTVGFDIVETTNYNYPCLLYSLLPGSKPVVTRVSTTMRQLRTFASGNGRDRARLIDRLEILAARMSFCLVTHANRHATEVARAFGLKESQFTIIPHGIEIPPTQEPFPDDAILKILFVGHLGYRKGIDVLLQCVPSICAQIPNIEMRIVGKDEGGKVEQEFRSRTRDRFSQHVHFLGEVPDTDLKLEFHGCHLLVVPSRYESFGLVYVEAMSYGRVPVGTTAGGIPEVIEDGVTGVLAEPGNADSLESIITNLLQDRYSRLRIATAAYKAAATRFSGKKMAIDTHDLYRSILRP